jgi:hypothetical protein
MSTPLNDRMAVLAAKAEAALPGLLLRVPSLPDELCYEVQPSHLKQVCLTLRDDPGLKFESRRYRLPRIRQRRVEDGVGHALGVQPWRQPRRPQAA